MKKMRISLLVVVALVAVAIIVLAKGNDSSTVKASRNEAKSSETGIDFAGIIKGVVEKGDISHDIPTWLDGDRNAGIRGLFVIFGLSITTVMVCLIIKLKQQKKILENQERDNGDHLKKAKPPIHV